MYSTGEYTSSTMCCGLEELHGVSCEYFSAPQAVLEIKRISQPSKSTDYYKKGHKPAHIFFTDVDVFNGEQHDFAGGESLVNFIKKYKLGEIYTSQPSFNNNSGNMVKMYMWTPDWDAIKKIKIKQLKQKRVFPE